MIKIGIIGFGYWGPNLARNFSYNGGCVIKKIVDSNPQRLSLEQKFYPDVETSKTPDSAITDQNIDGIVIALPVSDHYGVAKKALLNGKNVLIEKSGDPR